jgi:hypothetical protein
VERFCRRRILRGGYERDRVVSSYVAVCIVLQEVYVVRVNERSEMDRWDVLEIARPVPGPGDPFELIQPAQQENPGPLAA